MNTVQDGVAAAAWADATTVIIGAGQAGGWAAQTLRAEGFNGRIVLLGNESHLPYERPPLSKAVLSGEAHPQSTWLLKDSAFAELRLEWRPQTSATRIDRDNRRVELEGGEAIAYDKLILCTGGRARPLPVPGGDLPEVRTLRTIDDAALLAPCLVAGRKLVIVGGGWIGLEVAATARAKGMDVVVLEAQSRLCERSVPLDVSQHLLELHRSHGVEVMLGAKVQSIDKSADGLCVRLADGRSIDAHTVFAGVGLVANDELAREAGLRCDGGVVVDSACRTSDPSIFAAGDVAISPNPWMGASLRLESWQNAQEQGMAAARASMGHPVDYGPLPWFWSDQFGVNLQIYGVPRAAHRVVRRQAPGSDSFTLFYLDGEHVKAAIGFNAAKDVRFAKRLIEQQRPVDAERLSDTGIPMAKQ